jgi:hypothetical protein
VNAVQRFLGVLAIAAVLAAGVTGAASTGAVAAPQSVDTTDCFSYEQYSDGRTFIYRRCIRLVGTFLDEGPVHMFKGKQVDTLTIDGVFASESVYEANYKAITTPNGQVVNQMATYTDTTPAETCLTEIQFVYANGAVRVDRYSRSCKPG